MWFWLLSNIGGALLGAATARWFKDTKAGIYCYKKFEAYANCLNKKYGLDILDKQEKEHDGCKSR